MYGTGMDGCRAIVRHPDPRPDVYFVEATTPEGRQISAKVLMRQMYQSPSKPSDAELQQLMAKWNTTDKSSIPSTMPMFTNPQQISFHFHDISWPSYTDTIIPAVFRPAPDSDGIVRY